MTNKNPKIKEKKTLKLNNKRTRKNYLDLDVHFFKVINTEEKAYWLGYLAADGNIILINNSNNKHE